MNRILASMSHQYFHSPPLLVLPVLPVLKLVEGSLSKEA